MSGRRAEAMPPRVGGVARGVGLHGTLPGAKASGVVGKGGGKTRSEGI
jgi:hypothetical protein